MRWLEQVAHVAAKDARRVRWLGLAYAALVVAAAFQLGRGVLPALWSALALLLVLVAIAQVVQDDPAIRDDAFWLSRPLSPAAVFTAKLLAIVVAAAIAFTGQAVLRARYGLAGPALLGSSGGDAFIWLAVVGAAVMLAAVTRDLRGFALALVAVLACFAVGGVLEDRLKQLFTRPEWATPLLVLVGSLVIAGYQYVSGRRRRAVGLLMALVAASAVLAWAPAPERPPSPAAVLPVLPPALRPDSILVRAGGRGGAFRSDLAFRVAGGSPHLAYTLTGISLERRNPDGSTVTGSLRSIRLSSGLPALPALPGVRWAAAFRGDDWTGLDMTDRLRAFLGDGQAEVATGGLTPDRVTGNVEGWEPSVGARLPLRVGAFVTRPGRRLRVRTVQRYARLPNELPAAAGIRLELEVSRIDDPDGIGFFGGPGPVRFAILDRSQGLAFPVRVLNTGGGNGGTFLLPQPAAVFTWRLVWAQAPGGPPPPPPSDSLELLVFDWHPVGSYPVSIPVRASDNASAQSESRQTPALHGPVALPLMR